MLAHGADLDDETLDRLLDRECAIPVPCDEECLRYYAANAQKFRSPDLVFASHILFALTEKAAMTRVRAALKKRTASLRSITTGSMRSPERYPIVRPDRSVGIWGS